MQYPEDTWARCWSLGSGDGDVIFLVTDFPFVHSKSSCFLFEKKYAFPMVLIQPLLGSGEGKPQCWPNCPWASLLYLAKCLPEHLINKKSGTTHANPDRYFILQSERTRPISPLTCIWYQASASRSWLCAVSHVSCSEKYIRAQSFQPELVGFVCQGSKLATTPLTVFFIRKSSEGNKIWRTTEIIWRRDF